MSKKALQINNTFHSLNVANDATDLANEDYRFTDAQRCASFIEESKTAVAMNRALQSTIMPCIQSPILKPLQYEYAGLSIQTQEDAQIALQAINKAIIAQDKIRADLGALQNRFENTITNLNMQAENLQAAETRISDVDVSVEMTEFVRQQILSQAANAMLAQANSLPQMALQLIGG